MNSCNNNGFSVIMPVYNQAAYIRRAIKSVLEQSYANWELIIVNDGSNDSTARFIESFLGNTKIKYIHNTHNTGLGHALNQGIDAATYNYIAYLPADDFFDVNHLEEFADTFHRKEDTTLVFSGIRYDEAQEPGVMSYRTCKGAIPGYSLQLVQTAHRKTDDRWTERDELVTDDLFIMFWRKLTRRGVFETTAHATCEWTNHPYQRHKICGEKFGGGLNKYRSYYHVKTPLRFRASANKTFDEHKVYSAYRTPVCAVHEGLKILLVGELAYNPERIRALEEAGHRLFGLWAKPRFCYSTVGPLPFGNIEDIEQDNWQRRVEEIKPDIIYALLSTSAIETAHKVMKAKTGIPFVWHFKEGPHEAMKAGLWEKLIDLYTYSDGRIYLNEEIREWFGLFVPEFKHDVPYMVLDGDLPKRECFGGAFSKKLSDSIGGTHTVVTGRIIGLSVQDMSVLAANDIHVHLYNENSLSEDRMSEPYSKTAPDHFHIHRHCPQSQWVNEFSQYDAGWLHCIDSRNGGCIMRATWADLNLPARINTLAVAGLPMIQKDNTGNIFAAQNYVESLGMGIMYKDIEELARKLKDRHLLKSVSDNVISRRMQLTFDSNVARLEDFFKRVIETHKGNDHRQ